MAPLGDRPWQQGPRPQFPTQDLYIIPAAPLQQDAATGLPAGTDPAPVQVLNPDGSAPRVRLGAKLRPGAGGAMVREGDAWVSALDRLEWPMDVLVGARFYIGQANGELYQLMEHSLEEAGPATWSFGLTRESQPRT